MAIFGVGAFYPPDDVSEDFIKGGYIAIGWDVYEAPALHEILRYIKIGDIVYIKSMPIGQGLRIKAVGIVIDNEISENDLGKIIRVNWRWKGLEIISSIDDKYNVRNNTLYEEYTPLVQKKIIDLLCS